MTILWLIIWVANSTPALTWDLSNPWTLALGLCLILDNLGHNHDHFVRKEN